jgi:hypothetical protein
MFHIAQSEIYIQSSLSERGRIPDFLVSIQTDKPAEQQV